MFSYALWRSFACAFPAICISLKHHQCTPRTLLVPINCLFLFMISTVPISYLIYALDVHPSVTPTLALEMGHIQEGLWWSIAANRLC